MKTRIDILADGARRVLKDFRELEAKVVEAWPDIESSDAFHPSGGTWLYIEMDLTYYGACMVGVGLGPRGDNVLFEACNESNDNWWPLTRPPVVLVEILAKLLEVEPAWRLHLKQADDETFHVVPYRGSDPGPNPALDLPLKELALSDRVYSALKRYDIAKISDLARKTEADLYDFHQIGKATVIEIKLALHERSLCLGMTLED